MNTFRTIAGSLLVFVGALLSAQSAENAASSPGALCVMTFNLRYASSNSPNAWPQRRPVMQHCIEKMSPDLIGTQEGLYQQLKDIAADLPQYEWIGQGRDSGSRGEFMAVFYRKDRFEPLEYDYFWLSDTPEVIASSTWGNTNRRMVTWVRFRDRKTGQEFYFWNTHLDHALQPAREKAARLIHQRIQALNTSLPILLVGDFNAIAGSNKAYDILVRDGGLTDTWTATTKRANEDYNTFHGYNPPRKNGQRIDWILSRGPVATDAAEIVTFAEHGQYPSDHFPVVSWLRLGRSSGN